MHHTKPDVDLYPKFSAPGSDHERPDVRATHPASTQRSAAYDHDIEHVPIEFIPPPSAPNAWSNILDHDDSSSRVASTPYTALRPAPLTPKLRNAPVSRPPLNINSAPRIDQRPRWLGTILVSALCLAVAAAAGWGVMELRDPATLPLKSVRIEGAFTHVTTENLQQAMAGAAGDGFLYADVDALRQAALQVPWVRSVSVRRVWPDTLHVSVTEHLAVARWGDQALLSNEGKLFSPQPASYPADLPELHGPAGTQVTVLAHYRDMSKAIAPLKLHIQRLDLDARRAWRLSLDTGIELLLGRTDSNTHLQRFVRVYPSLLAAPAGNGIERVDMRYGNGLAVRWGKIPS
ncbi:MAG: cell division protein FtsQ/DivIB [Gammaproteobacteria bacterium]